MSVPGDALPTLTLIVGRASQRAAETLGQLSGNGLTVIEETAQIVTLEELAALNTRPEEAVVGVNFAISGAMRGFILTIFRWEDIGILLEMLLGMPMERLENLGEIELSMVGEAGNILVSSFLIEVEELCGISVVPDPPSVAVEMSGAVFTSVVLPIIEEEGELLLIEATIAPNEDSNSRAASCQMLFLPFPSEWKTLYSAFIGHHDQCPSVPGGHA